jgi:hypothetical protein
MESDKDMEAGISSHDLVISLLPYTHHPQVIKWAIQHKKHVVTTSYVSPAMQELHEKAKAAGITVLNEIGLDPGIDHLYAIKTIDEVHKEGGKVNTYEEGSNQYRVFGPRNRQGINAFAQIASFFIDSLLFVVLWWTSCSRGLQQPSWLQVFLVLSWRLTRAQELCQVLGKWKSRQHFLPRLDGLSQADLYLPCF